MGLEGFKARPDNADKSTKEENWQSKAACTLNDAKRLFFVQLPSEEIKKEREILCLNCPVRLECLEDEFANGSTKKDDLAGYRGGLTADARRGYKRQETITKLKIERNIF